MKSGEGGRGRRKGGKGRQDVRLVSSPCIIQQENRELGQVEDMDEVELLYACSAE